MGTFYRVRNFAANAIPLGALFGVPCYACYQAAKETFLVENECQKKAYNDDLNAPLYGGTQKIVDELLIKFVHVMSPKQLALTKFYWSKKPSVEVNGGTVSRLGTYIGIPVHYTYTSASEIDESVIKEGFNINSTDTELLKQLRDLLVLSDNAKKFAISSAVHYGNSNHVYMKGDGVVLTVGAFTMAKLIFNRNPLVFSDPNKLLPVSLMLILIWTAIHYLAAKIYYSNLQLRSDELASKMGDEILDGGLEYLDKNIEKNKLLLKLVPSLGGVLFDENGNEKGVYVTLNQRKQFLLKCKSAKEEESQKTEKVD